MPVLHEVAEPECRQLLGTVPIGRIGLSEQALPTILPVHFAVHGEDIVTVPLAGAQGVSAGRGDVVVFEVDSYDPATGEWWAVTVTGRSRLVTEAAEIADLDGLVRAPWMAGDAGPVTAVRMEVVRGHRVCRRSAAARMSA